MIFFSVEERDKNKNSLLKYVIYKTGISYEVVVFGSGKKSWQGKLQAVMDGKH